MSIGNKFLERYKQIRDNNPEIYKTFLLTTLLTVLGNCLSGGIIRSDMQLLALFFGAEKAGYTKEEILDFLALKIVLDYNASTQNFAEHLKKAEKEYDTVFWDYLFSKDIKTIISSAERIYRKVFLKERAGPRTTLGKPHKSNSSHAV